MAKYDFGQAMDLTKVLMIFIDGFGLGARRDDNPYFFARTPFFDQLLGGHILYADSQVVQGDRAVMIPTDACLGVPGIPQSATGQTTLWTGINAAQAVGCHINAYPTPKLREIIKSFSIMRVLAERGKKVTFANAYRPEYFDLVEKRKAHHSTSTWVAMSSGRALRTIEDLKLSNAVYQDFTNRMLIDWGYEVPELTPEQAGQNLAQLAKEHDFTLYEFFLSDKIGHARDMARAINVYQQLDRMIASCVEHLDLNDTTVMVVSDHGNLEDIERKGHTLNPVPTIIINDHYQASPYGYIASLTDVTPYVLNLLGK
jgi:hypothetical protein